MKSPTCIELTFYAVGRLSLSGLRRRVAKFILYGRTDFDAGKRDYDNRSDDT